MIDVHEAMRAVLQYRDGDLVVPTEMAVSAWADVTDDPSLDLPISAMSKGSSVGLGARSRLSRPAGGRLGRRRRSPDEPGISGHGRGAGPTKISIT